MLAGTGEIVVHRDDGSTRRIRVEGTPRSYALVEGDAHDGTLTLEVPGGVQAYSFTFG